MVDVTENVGVRYVQTQTSAIFELLKHKEMSTYHYHSTNVHLKLAVLIMSMKHAATSSVYHFKRLHLLHCLLNNIST